MTERETRRGAPGAAWGGLRSGAVWLALLAASPLAGQTLLSELRIVPETTVTLAGTVVADHQVAIDDLAGGVLLDAFPALPAQVTVDALARFENGDLLLSVHTTTTLPGLVVAGPSDVVLLSGGSFSIYASAAELGIPLGANLDALAIDESTTPDDLLFSIDVTAALLGGQVVADEDVVRYDGTNETVVFDGSDEGLPVGEDVDALDYLPNGNLLLSFELTGAIGGVAYDDEDVVEFDPTPGTYVLSYDGGASHAAWPASDLDAIAAGVEPTTVGFIPTAYVVDEEDGTATLVVRRFTGSIGAVDVDFSTFDATAIDPDDYTGTFVTVHWDDGDTADKTVDVPITNDVVEEADETFDAQLSNITLGTITVPDAEVTIRDEIDVVSDDPWYEGIPTLSEWGLMAFALALAGLALRRISLS